MATLAIKFVGQDDVGDTSKQVADDIKDVGKAADEAAPKGSGFFGGMLQAASGFLLANVVGAIGSQLGDLASGAMDDARNTQQLMAATETIIKNTGGAAGISAQEVADLASSLSDAAGQSLFGDDQIQGAENVLLKYKELKGIIPGVTKLSVDMAQSLGKDPAAAAEFLGRALQKPFDAAAKLAKEGIVLNDEQKKTLLAFKATGDTAGAQAFLMEQLNSTYAGSAQAAAKAAGGSVQFKARMGEVAEGLATAALPILDKLAGLLNDYVAPAIELLAKWIGDNLPAGIQIASDAIDTVIGWLTKAGGSSDGLSQTIQTLSDYWTDTLWPALQKVWQFIQDNVIPIIQTLVDADIAMLKEAIRLLAALWVNVLWPALQKIWLFVKDNIIPIITTLIVWVKDNLPPAIRTLADLWNNTLLPALRAVWEFINTKVLPILNAIGAVITAVLVVAFKLIVGTIMTTVIPAFQAIWKYISENILPIFDAIGKKINEVAGPAFTFLGKMIAPVVAYFGDLLGTVSSIVDWLGQLAHKISSIKIPAWAGGSGGDSGGGGGEAPSPEPPPAIGGGRANEGAGRSNARTRAGAGTQGATQGGGVTVRIVFDAAAFNKFLTAKVEEAMGSSGTQSFNRMRTGG